MTLLNLSDDDYELVLDRLRFAGSLEIDNATSDEQELEGIRLRELADRIERAAEITYEVNNDIEEMRITDSLGNEIAGQTGEGGLEYIAVQVGPIEYFVDWSLDPDGVARKNINAWNVQNADVWLDRRAASTIELGLPVGKLQDQDTVHRLITRFKEELT